MRNVLIPQGSEQTAKEGERQRKDREKKLEKQRARKQDRALGLTTVLSGLCAQPLIASDLQTST